VTTTKKLEDARVSVDNILYNDTRDLRVPTWQLGWYRDRYAWDEGFDLEDKYRFVMFHGNPVPLKKPKRFKLEMFLKGDDLPGKPIASELKEMLDAKNGKYRITVILTAKNCRPVRQTYLVIWTGDMKDFRMEPLPGDPAQP
jgi:hypothetical protein